MEEAASTDKSITLLSNAERLEHPQQQQYIINTARARLQSLERNIERRYLKPPLGRRLDVTCCRIHVWCSSVWYSLVVYLSVQFLLHFFIFCNFCVCCICIHASVRHLSNKLIYLFTCLLIPFILSGVVIAVIVIMFLFLTDYCCEASQQFSYCHNITSSEICVLWQNGWLLASCRFL